jgi:glycerophosphoryl diester phosphodiesterase
VQLSRDRHPLVFGPARLENVSNGRGRVQDHTVRELKRLDAGARAGGTFRGQRLQTLQEVLERFRDRALPWLELDGGDAELPERVVDALEIYDLVPQALVASAAAEVLAATRRLAADLRLAWLAQPTPSASGAAMPAAGQLAPKACEVIGLDAPLASRERVAAVRASGAECYAWNVRAPDLAARLASWGVAGIVTDRPGPLRARLGR